jgi:peptide/nickel transport system substrate-binding protein
MRGEVDAVEDLDFQDYQVIRGDPRFQVYEQNDGFYYTMLFNLEDPLFREAELRRALSLAVDRVDLIEQALDGWGVPAGGPFRPGTWAHDDAVAPDPCRPEEAAAILGRLGWRDEDGDRILENEGRELAFTLLVDRGDSLKEKAARRLRWQLYQAGARVEVEVLDMNDLLGQRLLPGQFQAVLLQFNGYRDPDFFAPRFWHSENAGRTNLARYRSAEADGLFLQGRRTADFQARKEVYHRLHRLIAADRPALFLFWRKRFTGCSARVGGVRAEPEVFFRSVGEWFIR